MRTAMVLAAGLGTRLRPLTDELPKPLVWVGDRPALAHVAERLAAAGVARAVANTHHLPEAFGPTVLYAMALPFEIVHEPAILGTAGGIRNAPLGPGDVVIWNGDIAADVDVGALVAAHARARALATIVVAPRSSGEGTVGLDGAGRVVRLRGERFGDETRGGDFLGVQVIGEALRRALPAEGCLVGDGYLPALRRGERIASFAFDGFWADLGSLAGYLAANRAWLKDRGATSFVDVGARVGREIDLEETVVGAGAVVDGKGRLERVVVWPGARATAPLSDAVVTPRGTVRS